jgi:hypothetical protein
LRHFRERERGDADCGNKPVDLETKPVTPIQIEQSSPDEVNLRRVESRQIQAGGWAMRFARIVFLAAGVYGLIINTPLFFMEERIGRETPPAITHPEHFYGFLGVTLAWQFMFLVLSRDPSRYRAMILPSILEKVSYGIALVILFAQHRLPLSVLTIGSVDWIFAALFIASYFVTKPKQVAFRV